MSGVGRPGKPARRGWSERVYGWILVVLPPSFRAEAEEELLEVFRDGYASARRGGVVTRWGFLLRVAGDLLWTVVAEWWARLRGGPTPGAQGGRAGPSQGGGWDKAVGLQLRSAVRSLTRRPGRTVVAATALGLGITTLVVAVVLVQGILLRPLPFPAADRLVRLVELDQNGRQWWPSYPNFVDWRAQGGRVFEGVAAADAALPRPVVWSGQAQRLSVAAYSRGFLDVLGVHPAVGRDIAADENVPGGPAVAVVSWRFWRGRLGGGRLEDVFLTIGTDRYAVVGVLPPGFRFFGDGLAWSDPDVWLPMERSRDLGGRESHGYHVVGRLRAGISLATARRAMSDLARHIRETSGERTQAYSVGLTRVLNDVVGKARDPLRLLLLAAGLVLLVACLNVAGLLLADGLGRDRELAVRLALGAGRGSLCGLLLLEAMMLALPGAAVGTALSWAGIAWLHHLHFPGLPRLDQVRVDGPTLLIAVAIALASAALAGTLPALLLSARNVAERLRSSMGSTDRRFTQRLWRMFIAGQAGLTLVLLFGTGLFLRSLVAALAVPLGYQPDHVLVASISLPASGYSAGSRAVSFYDRLLGRVRALPGVESAGLISILPDRMSAHTTFTVRQDGDTASIFSAFRVTDPGFFRVMRIPPGRGRTPSAGALRPGQAWIDEALAARLFGRTSPMGHPIRNFWMDSTALVAGTVGAIRQWNQDRPIPTVYVDYHTPGLNLGDENLVVRTAGDLDAMASTVRRSIRNLDPLVPVTTATLTSRINTSMAGKRLMLGMVGSFAAIALSLAALAIYALVAFAVSRRRREVGIRMALGAPAQAVQRKLAADGLAPTLAGMVVGLLATYPAGRLIRSQLFQVGSWDRLTLVAAVALLVLTAGVAALLPARAALRLDPARVLRDE